LPELGAGPPPTDEELRRCVLRSLKRPATGLRVLVEDVLGQTSQIDAVAVDEYGHVVAILIETGRENAALLTRGLAARAWLSDRIGDWAKLAPELKLREGTPVRALILAPDFASETRSAAESLPRGLVDCLAYRTVWLGAQYEAMVDMPRPSSQRESTPAPASSFARELPRFRSGLSDTDLGLSPVERKHFEPGD